MRPVMRNVFGSLGAQVSSKAPSGRTLMVWEPHVSRLPAHGETSIPGGDGSKNTSYPVGAEGPSSPPLSPPSPPPRATASPAPAATTTPPTIAVVAPIPPPPATAAAAATPTAAVVTPDDAKPA